MKCLSLETSSTLGSVAIGEGGAPLAEVTLSVKAVHSVTVLEEISRLLDRVGWRVDTLDAVVVGAGPGSFTGVRIAASLAKGLCFAHDLPLFAFSSLWAVAAGSAASPLCTVFDARRGEVYAAQFPTGGKDPPARGPEVTAIGNLLDGLESVGEWTFAGEGALVHGAAIESRGGRVLPPHQGLPRASALLWLAETAPDHGRVSDRALWEPEYIRASGAQRGVGRHV